MEHQRPANHHQKQQAAQCKHHHSEKQVFVRNRTSLAPPPPPTPLREKITKSRFGTLGAPSPKTMTGKMTKSDSKMVKRPNMTPVGEAGRGIVNFESFWSHFFVIYESFFVIYESFLIFCHFGVIWSHVLLSFSSHFLSCLCHPSNPLSFLVILGVLPQTLCHVWSFWDSMPVTKNDK